MLPSPLPVAERSLKTSTPLSNRIWSTVALCLQQSPSCGFCYALLGHANKPRTLSAPSGSLDREANRLRLGRHRNCVAFEDPPTHAGQYLGCSEPRRNCCDPADPLMLKLKTTDLLENAHRNNNIVYYILHKMHTMQQETTCSTTYKLSKNAQKNRGKPGSPTRAHLGEPERAGENRGEPGKATQSPRNRENRTKIPQMH